MLKTFSTRLFMVFALFSLFGSLGFSRAVAAQTDSSTCSGRPTVQPGLSNITIESSGIERRFLLYVPTGYDPAASVPLVISIHGAASSPEEQLEFSRWDEFAERDNFLAVLPAGIGGIWNAGTPYDDTADDPMTNLLRLTTSRSEDVVFFTDLLDYMESNFCVDAARVYANGLSNGGGMSYRLACELSDRITAIGTVGGAYTNFPGGCNPTRPIPVVSFHGLEDRVVRYEGRTDMILFPVRDWIASWAERDDCADMQSSEGDVTTISVIKYENCDGGAEVTLYTIADGGHTWAGGPVQPAFILGKTSQDIDATAVMWEFFQRFAIESTEGSAKVQTDSQTCDGLASVASGLTNLSINSGGTERRFTLYVPTGYDAATSVPLVLSIHGLASNSEQQRAFSRWDELAERDTFLAVFPNGTGFPASWNSGDLRNLDGSGDGNGFLGNRLDDVAFFNDLFDYLEANYCIDTNRVYVTGLSNGGGMSNRLACELSDRVTAIGTVAGAYSPIPSGCNPVRPMPVVSFHGTEDPIVPYEGTEDGVLPPILDWIAGWAERDGCTDTINSNDDPISSITYSNCEGDVEVVLYTIAGGGHSWAGGPPLPEFIVGTTSQDIDATAVMWDFFQRFVMER